MKNLFSRISKKGLLVMAVVVGAFGLATAAQAWSPDRPTYTMKVPADHVTFNSITDNPSYGDERTFFDAKDATNTASGGFKDNVTVSNGEEVLLRIYVHNNAAANLNGTNYDGVGVAKGAKLRIYLPTATANALRANAYVSATNAAPLEVADTVDFNSSTPFSLSYVPGSAVMYTNAVTKGFALNDSVVTTGAAIGYTGANGIIPGCLEYSGIVTIKAKVSMPDYSLEKKVRVNGTSTFEKSVTAKPGDKVDYVLAFKNTGSTTLSNVVVGDRLPQGVTYVKGSTEYISSATGNKWVKSTSDNVTVGGLDIGGFVAGGAGYVKFTAQLPSEKDLKCGVNEFVNTGYAKPGDYGTIQDTAIVQVTKVCEQPKTPVYSCDLVNLTKGDRQVTVNLTKYTALNGASLKMVTYNFGDGKTLTTDKLSATHKYADYGTYRVTATLTFRVNDKDVTGVTSESCAASVTFTPPTTPPVTPPELPNTGAGSVIGIFGVVSVLSAIGYRLFLGRKFAR